MIGSKDTGGTPTFSNFMPYLTNMKVEAKTMSQKK
jgi:hypothetical protein